MFLKLPFTLARSSGLLVNYERSNPILWLITLYTILNTAHFVVGIGSFLILNLNNFDYFTNSFGGFSNMMVNLTKTCMFIAANHNLKTIMGKLDSFTIMKGRTNAHQLALADQQTEMYTKKFLIVVYIAVIGITFSPILAMFFEYLKTGQVVENRWDLPFKSEL